MSSFLLMRARKATNAPEPYVGVPLTLTRMDGGSGSTLVTTGIPLYDTELTDATLADAGLWINGTEVACYLEGMDTYHPNGNLMWVLLQWTGDPATVSSCQLRFTGSIVPRLTKATPPRIPTTYFVPNKSRCDCFVRGLKMVPTGDARLPSWLTYPEAAYVRRVGPSGSETARSGDAAYYQWSDGRSAAPYDHGATMAMYGYRSGSAHYWYHMLLKGQTLTNNSQTYTDVVNLGTSEYAKFECKSFAWAWWLTGNEDYRTSGGHMARFIIKRCLEFNGYFYETGSIGDDTTGRGDNRLPAKAMQAFIYGVQCAMPTFDGSSVASSGGSYSVTLNEAGMDQFCVDMLTIVATSGQMGGTTYKETTGLLRNGEKQFMSQMVAAEWYLYQHWGAGDSRIPTAVHDHHQYMLNNLWVSAGDGTSPGSCYYYTQYVPNAAGDGQFLDPSVGATKALNIIGISAMAWDARLNTDATYLAHVQEACDDCFLFARKSTNMPGNDSWDDGATSGGDGKAFDETYFSLWPAMYELVNYGA